MDHGRCPSRLRIGRQVATVAGAARGLVGVDADAVHRAHGQEEQNHLPAARERIRQNEMIGRLIVRLHLHDESLNNWRR